ncbi:MAG: DedA family protein [Candidatus Woesearchaeota archaeon]
MLPDLLKIFFHLDEFLGAAIQQYGVFVYLIVFVIVFMETGLVLTPFLPGDSLLFVSGTLASTGLLNIFFLFILVAIAAVLGDTVNYWLGSVFGEKVFAKSRLFKKKYLDQTKEFYKKHGAETIILARFIPIVRTFAPFVAGIGKMNYVRFLIFNVIGALAWVVVFLLGGYFFGSLPFVRNNLTLVTLAIIVISMIPPGIEVWRQWRKSNRHI